ncbi:MAG TPA: hypothetical protein VGK24_10565 [Candidatus Angelobacter sp.]|jgi:hypothetical protein
MSTKAAFLQNAVKPAEKLADRQFMGQGKLLPRKSYPTSKAGDVLMNRRLTTGVLLAGFLLLVSPGAFAQQPKGTMQSGRSAEGTLTVTATVMASVGLVAGPDGEQRMIVANAADPRDNVSTLQPVVRVNLMPLANNTETPKVEKKSLKN